MRAIAILSLLLFVVGCAGHHEQPYVYRPPVVVVLKNVQHTNNVSIATFTVSNVGSWSMWYDGESQVHPRCCIEYKDVKYWEHTQGIFWGDIGLGRYELAPGQSRDFTIGRSKFSGPFRVGVWLGEQVDQRTMNDLAYWSDYTTP